MSHDDAMAARRRVWIGAVTPQPPPKQTPYAAAKGSEIEPGEFHGPVAHPDDVPIIDRKTVFPDDRY